MPQKASDGQRHLLVAHGGGPTAVINASLAGIITEARRHPRIGKIFAARGGIEGVLKDDLIDLTDIPAESLEKLKRTPSSAIGSCRYKVGEKDYPRIVEVLRTRGIGYFLYTGGNDSMDTSLKLSGLQADCLVAGVPKTIDNDLAGTDHSPGFGSAARFIAVSTAEVCLDIRALNNQVSVLEVMGRNAGWLAAASTLAGELDSEFPKIILTPERPFDEERFLTAVEAAWKERRTVVIVASEGLRSRDGNPLGTEGGAASVDSFGHALPGGVSHHLAALISGKAGIRARSEKPGLLGRASLALVSEVDRAESELAGSEAVRRLCDGESGFMIGFRRVSDEPYRVEPVSVPLTEVANVERLLPASYLTSDGFHMNEQFSRYCRPLMGGDPFGGYFLLRR